jgi:hypothetical protein
MTFTLIIVSSIDLKEGYAKAAPEKAPIDLKATKDQGILYFNKQMLAPAREQFELAFSTPDGKSDFIVVFYLAYIAEKQLRLEAAFDMAELAVKLAEPQSQDESNAREIFERLKGQFSYVSILAAKEETNKRGRIYLEPKGRILNKQKREQFQSIRTRFRSMDVELPTKIYLPHGRYTANNVPFSIKRNVAKIPEVKLFLHIIKKAPTPESNTLLYTGIGVLGATALGIGAYLFLKPEPIVKSRATLQFATPSQPGE